MTDKERAVFNFIRDRLDATGVSPTLQEVADNCGLASKSRAHAIVARLVEQKALEKVGGPGKAGNLRLPGVDLSLVSREALAAEFAKRPSKPPAEGELPPPLEQVVVAMRLREAIGTDFDRKDPIILAALDAAIIIERLNGSRI